MFICFGNPTYFLRKNRPPKIIKTNSGIDILFNYSKKEMLNNSFIPETEPVRIVLTSGASCPDAIVDLVLRKIVSFFPESRDMDSVLKEFE